MGYIFVADGMGLSSFKFLLWAPKYMIVCNVTRCITTTQGQFIIHGKQKSLILVPIESAYATFC